MCNCCCPVSSCLTVKTIGKATSWRKRPNLFLSFLFFLLFFFLYLSPSPPPRPLERGLVKKATHCSFSGTSLLVVSHHLVAPLDCQLFFCSSRFIPSHSTLIGVLFNTRIHLNFSSQTFALHIGSYGHLLGTVRTHFSGRFKTIKSVKIVRESLSGAREREEKKTRDKKKKCGR